MRQYFLDLNINLSSQKNQIVLVIMKLTKKNLCKRKKIPLDALLIFFYFEDKNFILIYLISENKIIFFYFFIFIVFPTMKIKLFDIKFSLKLSHFLSFLGIKNLWGQVIK